MIYYAGKVGRNVAPMDCLGGSSQKLSRNKAVSLHEHNSTLPDSCVIDKGESSSGYYDKYLWFGPRGNCGRYPSDHRSNGQHSFILRILGLLLYLYRSHLLLLSYVWSFLDYQV